MTDLIWKICLYHVEATKTKVEYFKVTIDGETSMRITGRGPTPHKAYMAAENQMSIKPWLTSKSK